MASSTVKNRFFQLDLFKGASLSALTMNADGTETVSLAYGDLHEQTYNGSSTTAVATAGWNAVDARAGQQHRHCANQFCACADCARHSPRRSVIMCSSAMRAAPP